MCPRAHPQSALILWAGAVAEVDEDDTPLTSRRAPADIHPPDRGYGVPEQIHIAFASDFFGEEDRQFWLVESAEPFPERKTMDWEEAENFRIGEDRDIDPALRIVQLER